MPTQGGPSRRSHTKSRKGCKTCKRRHIRCDENFPQCRNCTKHQVRCDYMDNFGSDTESQQSPEQTPIALTPNSENRIDAWQQTGSYPYPELDVFPQPPTEQYSRDELRLLDHLSRISNGLQVAGTSDLTAWTQRISKFISIASSYPYVMHALFSFSASHLAWTRDSSETRNLQIHHGGIALGGLHEAISQFSNENADATLVASLLLLWQATDWRSWSSLRSGVQSILTTMQTWGHESPFADVVAEEDLVVSAYRTHRRRPSVSPAERSSVLQIAISELQRLQSCLAGHELEMHWATQLLLYLQGLLRAEIPRTPEEQFNQLYHLRKWLFWVPVLLTQHHDSFAPAVATLAHFYATALALEPLFPDLGSSFCAAMSLAPLEATIRYVDSMSPALAMCFTWPQQMALTYRARALQSQQPPILKTEFNYGLGVDSFSYPSVGNISPAFAPVPLDYNFPRASSSQSSYLEVPTIYTGFSHNTATWGAIPSPGFPATEYPLQEEIFSYALPSAFNDGTFSDSTEPGSSQQQF